MPGDTPFDAALAALDVEAVDRKDSGVTVHEIVGLDDVRAAHREEVKAIRKKYDDALCVLRRVAASVHVRDNGFYVVDATQGLIGDVRVEARKETWEPEMPTDTALSKRTGPTACFVIVSPRDGVLVSTARGVADDAWGALVKMVGSNREAWGCDGFRCVRAFFHIEKGGA